MYMIKGLMYNNEKPQELICTNPELIHGMDKTAPNVLSMLDRNDKPLYLILQFYNPPFICQEGAHV